MGCVKKMTKDASEIAKESSRRVEVIDSTAGVRNRELVRGESFKLEADLLESHGGIEESAKVGYYPSRNRPAPGGQAGVRRVVRVSVVMQPT